jgi:predicted helicase
MDLHLDYEIETPYSLERIETPVDIPKAKLKADKEGGTIILDTATTLMGIPPEAWEYKLGHRSALEWVLNQYGERKPRDKMIRERLDTYRFADHKEHVIDLLCRVCTVSIETVRVVVEMQNCSVK